MCLRDFTPVAAADAASRVGRSFRLDATRDALLALACRDSLARKERIEGSFLHTATARRDSTFWKVQELAAASQLAQSELGEPAGVGAGTVLWEELDGKQWWLEFLQVRQGKRSGASSS